MSAERAQSLAAAATAHLNAALAELRRSAPHSPTSSIYTHDLQQQSDAVFVGRTFSISMFLLCSNSSLSFLLTLKL